VRPPQAEQLYHTGGQLVKRENEKILKNLFIPKMLLLVKEITHFSTLKDQSKIFRNKDFKVI